MSRNEYKRSTGYYSLRILRATGVDTDAKELFVVVQVRDSVQRTRVVQNVDDVWNETLPIRVPLGKTLVLLSLLRGSRVFPFSRAIGSFKRAISEMVKLCEGQEETAMELTDSGRKSMSRLVISLGFSDVQENATVALYNLLSLVDDDGELPLGSEAINSASDKVEQFVEEGKTVMRAARSIGDVVPQLDNFVDFVDNVAKAHPLLNVGWQLVAALYRVASDQLKLDKKIDGLLRHLVFVFDFVQDVHRISSDDGLASLRRTVVRLLDQLIESSLFIREYARRKFMKRLVGQGNDKQNVKDIEEALKALRGELKDGIELQAVFYAKEGAAGGQPARSGSSNDVLKEIRMGLELTPIMLSEMESSSHSQCMEDTRTEFLDDIVSWTFSDSENNIFWLRGIPGCGKSTVAQTISRHPKIQSRLVSHIFFKRENTRRHDILKLITYRLAAFNVDIADAVAARLHKPRSTLFDTYTNLILEPLNEVTLNGPIIIILDALDEYGTSESRVPLMQLIQNEFAKLPRQVRIFITSRPEADLVRAMSSQAHIDERELSHNSEESRSDVSAYIAAEMKKLVPAKTSRGPSWEGKMATFGKPADGLFIWASVAIELIRSAHRPYKKICALADNESKLTLDDLYKKALQAVDMDWRDDDVKQLFATLFALILPNRGSLTVELLDLMLGFEGDSSEASLFKLQSFLSYTAFGPVQVHHKTFADFLQSPARLPAEPWYISATHENVIIVERCFAAMEELHFDMCGCLTHSSLEAVIGDIAPHILYAALYWAEHLRGAEFSPEILGYLRAFLSERLLFWFEVLSHLKEFTRVASQALLNAMGWVSVHDVDTSSFLQDAIAIVTSFSSVISKAPKLIYATALPLSRKTNQVSAQYQCVIAQPIRIEEIGASFDVEKRQLSGSVKPFSAHQASVLSVVFSPDMCYIISGSSDTTVRVWNSQTGEDVSALSTVNSGQILSVAVSPEGRMIASGSRNKTIRLWDAESGLAIGGPLLGHKDPVSAVAFSPDCRRIVSRSWDKTIMLWDSETGKTVGKPFTGHSAAVCSVAWSPDGKRIVSGSHDNTIRVWDSNTGAAVGEPLRGHGSWVRSVTYSPDGRWIASGSDDKKIRIWDSRTGESVGDPLEGHEGYVYAVAFSPNGRQIVSGSEDWTVRIWDVETRTLVGSPLRKHKDGVWSVAFSRDGSRIVSGAGKDRGTEGPGEVAYGSIIVWDANSGKPIIGTGIQPRSTIARIIAEGHDGGNVDMGDDYQFFSGWKVEEGWLIGASGEHRLWLPGYLRGLVKQVDSGLCMHSELDLANCNGAAEGHKGFTFSD